MFGERIKNLRTENHLSQRHLSKFLGVTDRAVGYYEKEQRVPPQDILQKIADYFNVSVDYILGRTDIRAPMVREFEPDFHEGLEILKMADKKLSKKDKKLMINLMRTFVENKDVK